MAIRPETIDEFGKETPSERVADETFKMRFVDPISLVAKPDLRESWRRLRTGQPSEVAVDGYQTPEYSRVYVKRKYGAIPGIGKWESTLSSQKRKDSVESPLGRGKVRIKYER